MRIILLNSIFIYIYINLYSFNLTNIWGVYYNILYLLNFININFFILTLVFIQFYTLNFFFYKILIYILLFDYYNLNVIVYFLQKWPTSLLNGLNTIHPFFLYFGVISTLLIIFNCSKVFNSIRLILILRGVVLALILGMYWSNLVLEWGFFWVNDYIEFILLYLAIIITFILHTIFHLRIKHYLCIVMCFWVYNLLAIRLNIVYTRHSFFTKIHLSFWSIIILTYVCYIQYLRYFLLVLLNKYISILYIGTLLFFYTIQIGFKISTELSFKWRLLLYHYLLYSGVVLISINLPITMIYYFNTYKYIHNNFKILFSSIWSTGIIIKTTTLSIFIQKKINYYYTFIKTLILINVQDQIFLVCGGFFFFILIIQYHWRNNVDVVNI